MKRNLQIKDLLVNTLLLMFPAFTFAQSQTEINADLMTAYEKSDKKLNQVYHKILVTYKDDTLFIKNLKRAELLWIQLRDAEMDVKYPRAEELGSSFNVCYYSYLCQLTDDRTRYLMQWLPKVHVQGDLCAGSVR